MLPLLLACASTATPPVLPDGFWAHWGDGRAELDGYRLTTPRYGAPRTGYAVLIFVTETFTDAARVKSDGGHADEFPVLKLNDVRRFRTGIYDYALLTSTFVPLDGRLPDGAPTKVALGAQEWCGEVHDQVLVDRRSLRRARHSYFDGEADLDVQIPWDGASVFADALPVAVRGLPRPLVAPGGSVPLRVWPSLADVRLEHRDFAPSAATLAAAPTTGPVIVPAGTFEARALTLTTADGAWTTWQVEVAPPHRIVAWTRSNGEVAELTGSTRRAYWQDNAPGGEAALAELGLAPVSP